MSTIMITGSRDWPADLAPVVWKYLERIGTEIGATKLIHGECPYGGVDLIGASYAAGKGWEVVPYPPDRSRGLQGYSERNQRMVDTAPDVVVAFFLFGAKNIGTNMTYNMALRANLRVIKVTG